MLFLPRRVSLTVGGLSFMGIISRFFRALFPVSGTVIPGWALVKSLRKGTERV